MGNGHAGHLGHGPNGSRRPSDCIGGVQLLDAVALDFGLGVAMERHHGHLLVLGIHTGQDHGVGAEGVAGVLSFLALLGLVGAHEQHVEGAAIVIDRLLQGLLDFRRDLVVEVTFHLVDVGEGDAHAAEGYHKHGG